MKQAPEHLRDLIEPVVEAMGYECVGIEYNAHPKHGLLRLYIDSEQGVQMDDCAEVSHQVSGVLDVEDPIQGNYSLEVSSPGLDRPLFKLSHFERFIGYQVTVNLFRPVNNRRKITGVIVAVEGEVVQLQDQNQLYEVPFQAMTKARLVPDYLLGNGGQNG